MFTIKSHSAFFCAFLAFGFLSGCKLDNDNENHQSSSKSSSKVSSSIKSSSSSSKVSSSSSKVSSSVKSSVSSTNSSTTSSKAAAKMSSGATHEFSFDFNGPIDDWKTAFADYPKGEEAFYELSAGDSFLPVELGVGHKGLMLSGNNHSDDLYMYTVKKMEGLEPNTAYNIIFQLTFGTNAPKGCAGVGGSPGEGVTVKAGASKIEPQSLLQLDNYYRLNIDKGNQVSGGSDVIAIGDMAGEYTCDGSELPYTKKTVTNDNVSFSTFTADDGSLWITFGTDSGFEATTTIYLMNAKLIVTKK